MTDFSQHSLVHADGRVEAVNGPGPAVELVGNRIELLLAVDRQVHALGQILSNEPVDVLETAQMPRAVRVAEVHLHACVGRQLRVPGHLLALVVRQRLAHRLGNAAQLGRKAFQRRSCCGVSELVASITRRELRSTSTPTAERFPAPLMRSPFQCPGKALSFASGGRT